MVELSAINWFMPIFAFLLVFIVIYALLFKTKVLGENTLVMVFISLILAGFFIVEASLVEFVRFTSAWFGVLIVVMFFLLAILAFVPGKEPFAFLGGGKNNWFSWVLLGLIVAFFIISSAYVFNWVINWDTVGGWTETSWFGMVLLLVVAGVVSFVLTRKVK